ncbi:MAG: hypothetical protein H7A21_08365 [Spirochaetales bacterium]|nr:hypothetical protein [Leptospiraceae bacterium]MCP5481429.1 hypothetical protein [Spirochaetales bacterium]MCP5486027.1 hypothetical protein [Spirochaetales bacterium]
MRQQWVDLFSGMARGSIPFDGTGMILDAKFDPNSNYAIFEIIWFKNVKNIIPSDDSVTFQSDGHKIFLMYEPQSFTARYMEPYLREDGRKIPMRFNELAKIELDNRDSVFVSLKPYTSHGSFTVEAPARGNLVYYFFDTGEVADGEAALRNLHLFLVTVLKDDFRLKRQYVDQVTEVLRQNFDYLKSLQN